MVGWIAMAASYTEVCRGSHRRPGAPSRSSDRDGPRACPMKTFKNRERSHAREGRQRRAAAGDADFLVQGDRRISYGEFARRVWGAAHALRDDHGCATATASPSSPTTARTG